MFWPEPVTLPAAHRRVPRPIPLNNQLQLDRLRMARAPVKLVALVNKPPHLTVELIDPVPKHALTLLSRRQLRGGLREPLLACPQPLLTGGRIVQTAACPEHRPERVRPRTAATRGRLRVCLPAGV